MPLFKVNKQKIVVRNIDGYIIANNGIAIIFACDCFIDLFLNATTSPASIDLALRDLKIDPFSWFLFIVFVLSIKHGTNCAVSCLQVL